MRIHWPIALLGFAIILTAALSYWQWARGLGSQERIERQKALVHHTARVSTRAELMALPLKSTVFLQGRYAEGAPLFLLDNQPRKGVPGAILFRAFTMADGWQIFIDQGWVSAYGKSRLQMQQEVALIPRRSEPLELRGVLLSHPEGWLSQRHDPYHSHREDTEHSTLASTVPYLIGLDSLQLGKLVAFIDASQILIDRVLIGTAPLPELSASPLAATEVWLTPHRHFGYAVTWGLISLMSLIVFLALMRSDRWADRPLEAK